jgi:hypothetical protein
MIEQTIKRLYIAGILIMEYEEISGKGVKYRNHMTVRFMTGIKTGSPTRFGAYIEFMSDGELIIHAGYEWNGPNVIRDKAKAMRASIGHDPLVELVNAGLIDKKHISLINDLFKKVCMEDGMGQKEAGIYRYFLKSYWQGWFKG